MSSWTFCFSFQVGTQSNKKRACVSFKDTSISTVRSQTGVEHLSQTGMSEPSQARVQRRSASILLTFLSCLLNCTFPKNNYTFRKYCIHFQERKSVYFRRTLPDKIMFLISYLCPGNKLWVSLIWFPSPALGKQLRPHFLFLTIEGVWLGERLPAVTGSPASESRVPPVLF